MREKLETLSLAKLKEFAKEQEIKGYGSMRKAELIDILCEKAGEKEGKSAPADVSTGNEEPSVSAGEAVKQAEEPARRAAEPAKEEKAPAQTQAASVNRTNPNDKKRTVVRSYRQEGPQRTSNYRQSQGDSVERSDRQDRPEQRQDRNERQDRNDRQDRQDQRQEMNRIESVRETAEEARPEFQPSPELQELDSGVDAYGILEVMPDGFGFIRCENYLPGENDVYVAPSQIRRFNMKTGDIIQGSRRVKTAAEKFAALLFVKYINGYPASAAEHRPNFENMTPVFPDKRLHMETTGRNTTAMRVLDLLSPIGKGQRGMIVSPPKAGKTTLLKQVAKAVTVNHPDMHVIILLIDERPEEVTDIKESITGNNVEVLYSTFDELPERHKRVSEMVIERVKRLVEHGRDVIILLDSITRLARAYNLTVAPSGRTLSGGLDPAA